MAAGEGVAPAATDILRHPSAPRPPGGAASAVPCPDARATGGVQGTGRRRARISTPSRQHSTRSSRGWLLFLPAATPTPADIDARSATTRRGRRTRRRLGPSSQQRTSAVCPRPVQNWFRRCSIAEAPTAPVCRSTPTTHPHHAPLPPLPRAASPSPPPSTTPRATSTTSCAAWSHATSSVMSPCSRPSPSAMPSGRWARTDAERFADYCALYVDGHMPSTTAGPPAPRPDLIPPSTKEKHHAIQRPRYRRRQAAARRPHRRPAADRRPRADGRDPDQLRAGDTDPRRRVRPRRRHARARSSATPWSSRASCRASCAVLSGPR